MTIGVLHERGLSNRACPEPDIRLSDNIHYVN